ncbi:hypothetical protein PG988_006220 [Apiospora saccharicola]
MDTTMAINIAAKQLSGFKFARGRAFNNPKVVFAALVGDAADEVTKGMILAEIAQAFEARLFTMVTHATRGHELFRRLRGNSAFFVYVALDMNPSPPLSHRCRVRIPVAGECPQASRVIG